MYVVSEPATEYLHCHRDSSVMKLSFGRLGRYQGLPTVHFLVVLVSHRPAVQQQPRSLAKTRSKTREKANRAARTSPLGSAGIPCCSDWVSWTKYNLILHSAWIERIMIRCTAPHTWTVNSGQVPNKALKYRKHLLPEKQGTGSAGREIKPSSQMMHCVMFILSEESHRD